MRETNEQELEQVIKYWLSCPRCSAIYFEDSLIEFLMMFTPLQIKGAMYLATAKEIEHDFRYLCGILNNWKAEVERGKEPVFFEIPDTPTWDYMLAYKSRKKHISLQLFLEVIESELIPVREKLDELGRQLENAGLIDAQEGEFVYRKALEYFEEHVNRLVNNCY